MAIYPPHEAFYIDCLLWHTASARRSIYFVLRWLELVRKEIDRAKKESKTVLFDELQNIIQQGGATSRYFWPSRPGPGALHESRARDLRLALQVHDDSPLHVRELRNSLEHFDERLDSYLAQQPVGVFEPDDINYETPTSEVPLHTFKAFYTVPEVFVLLGARHEMAPLMNELLRLHSRLMNAKASQYRLARQR